MAAKAVRDPVTIVREGYAALARGDGASLADLVDPEVLDWFREYWIAGVVGWAELTDDGRRWPEGSGGSAETGEITPDRIRAHATMPVENVDGITNLGELAALTSRELLSRVTAAWARAPEPDPVPSILGAVPEGADLAHVVYRRDQTSAGRLSIISVRLRDGEWRLLSALAPGPAWGSPTLLDGTL